MARKIFMYACEEKTKLCIQPDPSHVKQKYICILVFAIDNFWKYSGFLLSGSKKLGSDTVHLVAICSVCVCACTRNCVLPQVYFKL